MQLILNTIVTCENYNFCDLNDDIYNFITIALKLKQFKQNNINKKNLQSHII